MPLFSLRLLTLPMLTLVAAAAVLPLAAQSAGEVLTKAADVISLPDDVAQAGTKTVRISGVVTYVSTKQDEISVHDGENSVSVALTADLVPPDLGTKVEVEGSVFSESHLERKRTRIKGSKLTVLGTGQLPQPKRAEVEDVSRFKHLDQWVSVEGTVMQVRSSMTLFTIQLVDGSAACNVIVRGWPREDLPRDWIGGRVRVTGINRAYLPGNGFLSVIVPNPTLVTVVKTGVVDPMDAPATTVDELRKMNLAETKRVKLTGVLLGATTGNVFYARCDDGSAFSFYMLHPIDEDKSGRFSTPIVQPKCEPGDVLEVVGIPGRVEPGIHLNFGVVRVLRPGPVPAALSTEISEIAAGQHVHDLVVLQGRLLTHDDVLVAPGRWRTTMRLEDAGQKIIASLDAPNRGALLHLEEDQLVRVRGVVTGAPHFPEIRVWVPTADDVKSLGVATDVVTRRLWVGLAVAGVVVLMLAGWVFMLGRSRKIVRELNASLEKRVDERTAALAAAKDDLALALSHERDLLELKTRFVSLVSHEFRTPLGITMSAVEVLRHYGEQIQGEKKTELLDDIFSATMQMRGLMEQVLLLGKAEAGKLQYRLSPVNLEALCHKLVDEAQLATKSKCPITLAADGDFSGAVMDETMLRHIVSNLLSNAVKYSSEGSPVDVRLHRQGDDAVLIVEDHGIGIPVADQGRLFEAFHRASNVGETPGTGLGLLLVKHCVALHHGSISVESQEGAGTTFTVRLPLQLVESEQ